MLPVLDQIRIVTDAAMDELSTYKIGGRVSYLAQAKAAPEDLAELISWAKGRELPWTVIGNGSNILMPDEDLRALIIKMVNNKDELSYSGGIISVGAGVNNADLATFTAAAGLSGFGFLYDIPGTIGGAITQNAGMNEENFSQLVKTVTHVAPNGQVFCTPAADLDFGYRRSAFKTKWCDHIITGATLIPKGEGDPAKITAEMEDLKAQRWAKFPMEYGNCGSVFKRPEGYFAGKLIQDAGLSGFTMGAAQVSTKHRNFLVNLGHASAKDIKNLVAYVQAKVLDQSGVQLERELIYLEDILH